MRLWTLIYGAQRLLAPRAYQRGVAREQAQAEAFFTGLER